MGTPRTVTSNTDTKTVYKSVQKTPIINWPNPDDITYGTELSGIQLDASASDPTTGITVPGTYFYYPLAGTTLNAGPNQELTVEFTPIDSTDYTTATGTAYINVNQATPNLAWTPSPDSITYGTALVAGQLNAQSSASGTFAYTEGSTPVDTTTVLSAGMHTLTATFTSTDPNYASGGTVTATITVTQATPIINWNNPADIPRGPPTALGNTQLNAVAVDPTTGNQVSGTYAYNPPETTVLNPGLNQPLSVKFTPDDSIDYATATDTVHINVTFMPNPNGYSFQNGVSGEHSWNDFVYTYNLDLTASKYPSMLLQLFYSDAFASDSDSGNCFGMTATSLLTYNNGVNDEFKKVSASSQVPSDWLAFKQPFRYLTSPPFSPANVRSWIILYQPLEWDQACINDRINSKGRNQIFTEIKKSVSNGLYNQVLLLQNLYPGQTYGHALIPYNIEESQNTPYEYIDVYDCCYPGNNPIHQVIIDPDSGQMYYDSHYISNLQLVSYQSITNQYPELPEFGMFFFNYAATPLYTAASGNKLGYDNGVFKDEIPGTCPLISSGDSGNNNNLTVAYYVPDPSIKMELYGRESGTSQVSSMTPKGLIVANVTVSPNSIDELKILNNGTGVYFNSENDTTQSLGLMLDVETPNFAQIVNASISQIEKGGYINLSNNNGTITLPNSGLPRTCNLSLQQVTSNQNSSINLTNIAIEGNSTVNIVPSNWNDLGNSTVTIEDVGSNGQVYYTEIITYQNSQVTQVTFPSTILTMVKSADPISYGTAGQTITYRYTITNSGNIDISAPITVTDDKAGTVPIQNSGILSPGSSVSGTAIYKITDADINTGSVTNLASATASFNNQPIMSSQNIVTVHYKQLTNDRTHDGGYGGAVVPVVPVLMMYSNPMSNPMYSSPMYGSELYGYSGEPYSTTETQDSKSHGHNARAHLSKHKHHTNKHHKTAKKSFRKENY